MPDSPDGPEEQASNQAFSTGNGRPSDVARLEAEIEATRDRLGETVAALANQLDVKTRAKSALRDPGGRVRPEVSAAGAAALVLVVGLLVWRHRRRG